MSEHFLARNVSRDYTAISERIVARYTEVFPGYVFTDVETSLDLMAAEIHTLRMERGEVATQTVGASGASAAMQAGGMPRRDQYLLKAMTLTPVESSHVAAIGYLEDERVLLVRYVDGALFGFINFTAADWVGLNDAPSKGHFLYCWDRHGVEPVRITKGGNAENRIKPEQAGAASTTAPLNVIDDNADTCCRRGMEQFLRTEWADCDVRWTCGDCGTQFYPEMVGPVRHWKIREYFAVQRPGGR